MITFVDNFDSDARFAGGAEPSNTGDTLYFYVRMPNGLRVYIAELSTTGLRRMDCVGLPDEFLQEDSPNLRLGKLIKYLG